MEVQLQAILILALDKRVWSTTPRYSAGSKTPVVLWGVGWEGPLGPI